ncbi:WYL domain-containing protein [Lentibacillus kimchii]
MFDNSWRSCYFGIKCSCVKVMLMNRLLQRAVQTGNKFEIIYLDARNHVSQRIIRVHGVQGTAVTAFCFTRRRIRTFKQDRILSIRPIRHWAYGA